jgi:hypothetical protein
MNVWRPLIATAVALLLAGCASGAAQHAGAAGSSSAAARKPTTVRTFQPYSAAGRLTVPVRRSTSGHCWETSLAAPDAHTYRCLSANKILDPCFASSAVKHPASLACFVDPWHKAVLLRLRRKLPKPAPIAARSWAVVLANGTRCVATTGTAPFVHHVGLGYRCADGTAAALRNVTGKRAYALVGRDGGHSLHRSPIRTIWRA